MAILSDPVTISGTISAAPLNTNFGNIVTQVNGSCLFKDVAGTVTVSHTFTPAQTFSGGWTAAAACTISSGGIAVTGASTITGTLGGLTGLTVVSGGATITAGNLALNGGQAVAKRADDGDSGTADTIDWNAGNLHRSRLTGTCTYTFSNPATGATYLLEVLQDGTGSRTVTWPAAVVWEGDVTPTLTTTANRKDVFAFLYNGAKYLGTIVGLNFNDTT